MDLGSTMRIHRPAEGVLAFYDGRVPGVRAWSPGPNWLDDGAYELGVCSYAVHDGDEALVYDTHVSVAHAGIVRRTLEALGIRRFTVVLSHWHADHVAGTAAFADGEIIAHALTARMLDARRSGLEGGDPPIRPLVGPTRLYEDALELTVGRRAATLRHADAHSLDGTVLLLPDVGLMLAGDTLEDTVTYVAEPTRLGEHRRTLCDMAGWPSSRILPAHGAEERIAAGGYGPDFIAAAIAYLDRLLAMRDDPATAVSPLQDLMAGELARGAITWFDPYERVHRQNVSRVRAAAP